MGTPPCEHPALNLHATNWAMMLSAVDKTSTLLSRRVRGQGGHTKNSRLCFGWPHRFEEGLWGCL